MDYSDPKANKTNGVAVALSYDGNCMQAPQITSLCRGLHAKEMLKISERYGIPTKKNVDLAQKLDKLAPSDQIPEELFEEVAKIFVSLKTKKLDK